MPTDPAHLDAAIRAADPELPETMEELARALASAELLVPIQPAPGEDASLVILQTGDVAYVPAYTTPEAAIGAVPEDVMPVRERSAGRRSRCLNAGSAPRARGSRGALAIGGTEVAMALNAGSAPGGWLEGEGVRRLAASVPGQGRWQPATARVPAGTEVALGEPEEEPEALLQVIGHWLERDGRVAAAYRGVMARSGDRPRWVIGLVASEGDGPVPVPIADVARALAASLVDVTGGGQVDVLPIDPAAPDTVGEWLLDVTAPFWSRTPADP
jgi:hypothetical protein